MKANANGGTLYLPEGAGVPPELAGTPGLTFVGPGAGEVTDEPAVADEVLAVPEPAQEPPGPSMQPANSGASPDPADDDDGPPDYLAYRIIDLRDLCRDRGLSPTGSKIELAERLAAHDAEHAAQ